MAATQEAGIEATHKATMEMTEKGFDEVEKKTSKMSILIFKEEKELKLTEFAKENKQLYNNKLVDYKDPNKPGVI